ncbi:MAG: peptidoglycan bridge formation glycyltransferase FemA/FemB family protein [Armatimonadota bacterium]
MLLDESRRDEWNEFVRASEYPSVMQSWQWGELKAATGWDPMIVAVEDEDAIAAGAMILRRPVPHVGKSLLYAPRGPVLDWSNAELFSRLIARIRDVGRDHGAIALKIDPCLPVERSEVVGMIEDEGFAFTGDDDPDLGGTQPRYVMKTDLTPDPDDIMADFHKKWRYNIRLAGRRGIEVREGTRDDLPEFYEILEDTAERDEFRVRGFEYFERIHDLLAEDGLAKLFVAEFEGEIVAGVLVFTMGKEAVYVYGGSDPEYYKHMPNHRLHWEIMLWAREQGCTAYDFRGVSKEVDGEPVGELGGLNRFKRGFNAQYIEYVGEYDLVLSPVWYGLYAMAMNMRG